LQACNEPELAYALANVFDRSTDQHVLDVADKCAKCGGMEQAMKLIIEKLPSSSFETEIGLLFSKYFDSERDVVDNLQYYLDSGLASPYSELILGLIKKVQSGWLAKAKDEETLGSDIEAVRYYVISRQYSKAASMGIVNLKKFVREPLDKTPELIKLFHGLQYVRASELEEPLRSTFLSYMLWFSAHSAAELGLWETGWNMLR
jgi:hypothetical protein